MRTVSNQNRSRCISDMFIEFDSRLPPLSPGTGWFSEFLPGRIKVV